MNVDITTLSVEEFLKQDRSWPRNHRITHARMQKCKSKTPEAKAFWAAVLEANGTLVDPPRAFWV